MKIESVATKYNMRVNPDKSRVDIVVDKLEKNNNYCPCLNNKNADTLCPCTLMRTKSVCRCGLFLPKERD